MRIPGPSREGPGSASGSIDSAIHLGIKAAMDDQRHPECGPLVGLRALGRALFDPRPERAALETALAQARARAPIPVIWLVGKTQAGKTSIVRALTGNPQAEIGSGFRPCTCRLSVYDYPPEAPVVRFLDSPGLLGEWGDDLEEELHLCESQAHLVLGVMRAGDLEQGAVWAVLRAIQARHPDWPILIAQTALHECYPPGFGHPQPYPFATFPWPPALPPELTRALLAQRAQAGRLAVQWVAVDLTLPEDGYEPTDYGLDQLWQAIETACRQPLRRWLVADPEVQDLFERAAHPHILGYAWAAAGLGALPFAELAGVPLIQAKMLHSLAALHGQSWDRRAWVEFAGLLGAGFGIGYGLRMLGRNLLKLVPLGGQTLGALWGASASGVTTFALGKAAAYYLRRRRLGLPVEAAALRAVFAEQSRLGRELLVSPFPQKPLASS